MSNIYDATNDSQLLSRSHTANTNATIARQTFSSTEFANSYGQTSASQKMNSSTPTPILVSPRTNGTGSPSGSASSSPRPAPKLSLKLRLIILGEKFLDIFVRCVGPLLSFLAVFLILFVTHTYFTEVVPLLNAKVCHGATQALLEKYVARGDWKLMTSHTGRPGIVDSRSGRFMALDQSRPNQLEQMQAQSQNIEQMVRVDGCGATYTVTAFGLYLLFNILFHYFACMLKGPGRPQPKEKPYNQEVLDHLSQYDPERREDQTIRFCKTCQQVKPMRCHHCRVCGACGLKMDHHCPWVNTCIGYRNYRHFLSFLFFLWSGCAFFLLTGFDSALQVLVGEAGNGTTFLIAVIVAFAACLAVLFFLGWSGYLLVTNQTTIEFYGNHWGARPGNPYFLDYNRNIAQVFGEGGLLPNLFIPSLAEPLGDGIIYPLNQGRGLPLPMLINERTV